MNIIISEKPWIHYESYHIVSGYGGFGNGGAGLPGGLGAGSKPGYPVGTGVCFIQLIKMESQGLNQDA